VRACRPRPISIVMRSGLELSSSCSGRSSHSPTKTRIRACSSTTWGSTANWCCWTCGTRRPRNTANAPSAMSISTTDQGGYRRVGRVLVAEVRPCQRTDLGRVLGCRIGSGRGQRGAQLVVVLAELLQQRDQRIVGVGAAHTVLQGVGRDRGGVDVQCDRLHGAWVTAWMIFSSGLSAAGRPPAPMLLASSRRKRQSSAPPVTQSTSRDTSRGLAHSGLSGPRSVRKR